MGLHIMASKRIPRKVKKALKYVYLLPRRNGNMIQYGRVDIIGNRSKWKRKAAKVLRARDLRKMINEIASIQTQIDFNSQVAEDNSKYIAKLKELIS